MAELDPFHLVVWHEKNTASVGGILYVCDDLPSWIIYCSFSFPFELKMEIRFVSLLFGRTHPKLTASESWHCSKEAASMVGTFWPLVILLGNS